MLGCAAGAWLMRGAGCTWNDITDRDIDGSVARTRSRPIPSGAVSARQALGWDPAETTLISLGTGRGGLHVPYSVLEAMKEARAKQGLPS